MQNPPPEPQSYGSPDSSPEADATRKASTGLDANLAAALSYIGIIGLIFFILEKENRFVRFHALQSLLCQVVWIVLVVILVIINVILGVIFAVAAAGVGDAGGAAGVILMLLSALLWTILPLAFIGALLFAAIKAYQRKMFKLPIIGNIADKILNK